MILMGLTSDAALAAGECKFKRRPPITLKNMGPCEFDLGQMRFKGEPAEQAACLTTKVVKFGGLGERAELPPGFARRVGRSVDLPKHEAVLRLLQEFGLEPKFGPKLSASSSHAHDNDPLSPPLTYFVIHDTSSPNFLRREFPADIDNDRSINNLERYRCSNNIEPAHVFVNRSGEILLAHDFDVPWRATKFEMATNFAAALKGLFVHVELVQPRRSEPGRGSHNDYQAPSPGFSAAQYERLALVYVVASRRAGRWLIPAFHAVLDDRIYDKHDDPQNFEFALFAENLEKLLEQLKIPSQQGRLVP